MIDWESLGGGAATGFVTAILTLLGWNKRISNLEDTKVDKELLKAVDAKVEDLREDFKYIRGKLDDIWIMLGSKK